MLTIRQTVEIHERVERLLTQIRKSGGEDGESPAADAPEDPAALQLVVYDLPVERPIAAPVAAPAHPPQNAPQSKRDADLSGDVLGSFGGFGDFGNLVPIPGNDVMEVVVVLVDPESWNGEGVYIKAVPGRLIVRHTAATHRKIERLLMQLRLIHPYTGGYWGGPGYPVVGRNEVPLPPARR